MNKLPYTLLCVILSLVGFIIGFNLNKEKVDYYPIIETDTITVIDTLVIEKPVWHTSVKTEHSVDTLIQYVNNTDTLYIPLQFPIIERTYENNNYKAVVKGVEFDCYPALESLEIYQMNNTITNTVKQRENANRCALNASVGLGCSYDLYNRRIVPTVGIYLGWGYRIK